VSVKELLNPWSAWERFTPQLSVVKGLILTRLGAPAILCQGGALSELNGRSSDGEFDSGVPDSGVGSTPEETTGPSHAESVLEEELATFEDNLLDLLGRARGKYALVKGAEIVATFTAKSDAIAAGYEIYGNVPFLVNQVIYIADPLMFFS
jgi:hypothetical protein